MEEAESSYFFDEVAHCVGLGHWQVPSGREKDPTPGLSGDMVVPLPPLVTPEPYSICSSGCVCVTVHEWAVTKPWWMEGRCSPVPASWGLSSLPGGDLGRSVAEQLRPLPPPACLESHHWRCTAIPVHRHRPIMEAHSFLDLLHTALSVPAVLNDAGAGAEGAGTN